MDCRKCKGRLCQIDVDIHPGCLKQEEAEKNPQNNPRESEFDKALVRYPYPNPDDAA